MGSIDYKKLYSLQDRVLETIFSLESEFYLTGGTCLNRFYHEKRYSDDLDFFTNSSNRFSFSVRNMKLELTKKFEVTAVLESKDFVRFMIDDLLQIDFVNDRVPHYKDVIVLDNGYVIDNVENILSNKLTAVIGRDNPKDVFDICLISKYYRFDWKEILESAHQKAGFGDEELIVRLKSFPKHLLQQINLIDNDFLQDFDRQFETIIEEITDKTIHLPQNIQNI